MGMLVHGRLLELSEECVAYEFVQNQHEDWDDVVVIPLAAPDAWHVRGTREPDPVAARIVFKARRAFEYDGVWPAGLTWAS